MADTDLQIRGGGGHPDPEIRGGSGLQKNCFRLFGPHFGQKIMGGGEGRAPRVPPLDTPLGYPR